MQVKRFKAFNMQAALAKVKEALGPDAIIFSTKEIPNKPGLPPTVEIMAVADPSSTTFKDLSTQNQIKNAQKDENRHLADQQSQYKHNGMEEELSQIKEMLLDLTYRSKLSEHLRNRKDLVKLYRDLIESELDPFLVRSLIEQIAANGNGNGNGPEPKKLLLTKLKSMLKVADPAEFFSKTGPSQVVILLGPCGVGKTTTLVKMAAVMSLQKKKKVALISLDTFRLGAADQLLTFSRIMGLPFKAAQGKDEFKQWVELFEDMDLILVDTPGRTLSKSGYLDELADIIDELKDAIVLLVVSATTKGRDICATIEQVRHLPIKGLIISMIDATDRYGNVISNLIKYKVPVSYLTNGQKVPDDLIPATLNCLAELIIPSSMNI